jgi:hypothetical protein
MSSRSQLTVVIVAMLAFALGFWLWSRGPAKTEPPRVAMVAATESAAPRATATPIAPTAQRSAQPGQTLATGSGTPKPLQTNQPYGSMPIIDGLDPVAQERQVEVGKSQGPNSKNPRLIVFPSTSSYEAPNPILLYAYLAEDIEREDEEGKKEVVTDSRKVPAREIRGELRSADGTSLMELRFHDDGKDGDAAANDDFFTATFEPTPEGALDLAGKLTIDVRATSKKGEQRTASTTFLYSVPAARLTGNYRDEVVDGHLRISTEVEVEETGTFRLDATIADNAAQFVGWAYNTVKLEPGTHWIPLTYSGSLFHQHKANGPYMIWSLAFATISREPPEQNDVVASPFRTQPYTVDQFANRDFE